MILRIRGQIYAYMMQGSPNKKKEWKPLTEVKTQRLIQYLPEIMQYADDKKEDLAGYVTGKLKNKILSIIPGIETDRNQLVLMVTISTTVPLSPGEILMLKEEVSDQLIDGWGEGFEQFPVQVKDGELYLSFYDHTSEEIHTDLEVL